MASILQKARSQFGGSKQSKENGRFPKIVSTSYTSAQVEIPDDFLSPLPDPSAIQVSKIDFANTSLPEYKGLYAVVLDNVLSREECNQLLHLTEQSAGAHQNEGESTVENNGWKQAMVNAGIGREFMALDYRNSDRIIWDNREIVKRLWERVLQGKGMKEGLDVIDGSTHPGILGECKVARGERWVATKQGLNERMRFLKYGPGQFFREHCDGTYETPDGQQRSYLTLHLYLNDSVQARKVKPTSEEDDLVLCEGGPTTFHSVKRDKTLDVDPLAGRVLIFQHRRLLHSGAEVTKGTKYTMRSDLMYEFEAEDDGGDVVFAD